jgi:hypothetical protein
LGNRPIWVDRARTQTAADINDLDHCDALIRRFERDIANLREAGANKTGAPRDKIVAFRFSRDALAQLIARRAELCQSQ